MDLSPFSSLAALISSARIEILLRDASTLLHLGAMTVALGSVILSDLSCLRKLHKPVTQDWLAYMRSAHDRIAAALAVLWLTGLSLFWLKTGGDLALASPKLMTKLVTVTGLSLAALAMGRLALPLLIKSEGQSLLSLPLERKLLLAGCGAFSVAGWSLALILGGADLTRTAEAPPLIGLYLLMHIGALAAAWLAVLILHGLQPRAQQIGSA